MNKKAPRYYFILGGNDLEMNEIQNLLIEHSIPFENDDLSWENAKWENYASKAEEIVNRDDRTLVVGVELMGKSKKPVNPPIIDIDHHNFERCKPASIEQVAELLDMELDDWQKKVAVNDKGYIPGLLDEGVSIDEIETIRRKDREAQGLTEADFAKARNYLKENPPEKDEASELLIWKLPDDAGSFTPYIDAFFFQKLNECLKQQEKNKKKKNPKDCAKELKKIKLISFNSDKFQYSGYIPAEIIEKYKDEIKEDKNGDSGAFFGGAPDSGFFGFTPRYVKEKGSKNLLTEWKEVFRKIKPDRDNIQNKEMYSYHIFMFPFRWRLWNKDEKTGFNEKFELSALQDILEKGSNRKWERRKYKLYDAARYNEYNYFFDFVREILYDLDDSLRTSTNLQNEDLIHHYEYTPADISKGNRMFYNIKVANEVYSLEIDSIILNIYSTGVGILSFHLRNKKYNCYQDILRINKFGRRLYPPYLYVENKGMVTGNEFTFPGKWLNGVKNNELPEAIWLSTEDKIINESYEDYSRYYCSDNFKHGPFLLPGFITALFPEKFFLTHEKLGYNNGNKKDKESSRKDTAYKVYLRPAMNDDRMYTISWYGNDEISEELKKISYYIYNQKVVYKYAQNDFWHNFIFADDKWPTFQNKLKLPAYLEDHTYDRWIDYGTLYGMSRYSLVMLTSSLKKLEKNNAAFLVRHIQTMYYKMAELSLLQRATLIGFSDEVTHVSDLIHRDGEDMDKAIEKIEDLYKHYILFVNKIYFREVTAQEQGIEMYNMMQRIMRIPEQVKDLDNEIAELNAFAGMIADKEEKKEMRIHTTLGTVFLPAMLVTGFLGMNYFSGRESINLWNILNAPWFWIPAFLLALIFVVITNNYKKKFEKEITGLKVLLIWFIIMLLFTLCFMYCKSCCIPQFENE